MAKRKSADQLVADIDARRARIVKTIADIQTVTKPANVAARTLTKAKALFVGDDSKIPVDRIAEMATSLLSTLASKAPRKH